MSSSRRALPSLLSLSLVVVACDGRSTAPQPDAGLAPDASDAFVCEVTAPTSCPDPAPTYLDVEEVFDTYCVGCHYGEPGGPWPLISYPHVAAWQSEIRAAMLNCSMPPRDSGIAMPREAREQLLVWLRCGAPD